MGLNESTSLLKAIEAVSKSGRFFCKFLSVNDTGINDSHQSGIYLNISSWSQFFKEAVPSEGIKDRFVRVHTESKEFDSRIVYYTSKKEFRITQFWSNSHFTNEEQFELVGALFIMIPKTDENEEYEVFIFNTEEEIEDFTQTFSISMAQNFSVYDENKKIAVEMTLEDTINELVRGYDRFPVTKEMAEISRKAYMNYIRRSKINPDNDLVNWINTEYTVFKLIEQIVYKDMLIKPFGELQPLLDFASSALNRRKSRAGRSLEHHLNYIFTQFNLPFENPGKTEGNKKPDFLIPSTDSYHNNQYPVENLFLLGVKTTCKDRWRQVLSEGERVSDKYLLTLQQGISENQLREMQGARLQLIVPKPYHNQYPKAFRDKIWSVQDFIKVVKGKHEI